MGARSRALRVALPLERLVTVGALIVMAGFYVFFVLHVHWTGQRWWERAAVETAQGRNIYIANYRIWLTHSEPEPFFGYGSGSLYGAVPLYLAAREITGDDSPDLFAQLCVVWSAVAQAGLALVGAQIVRRQSGSRGAAAATAAALALNPILLRLGAMGDVIDITMLFLCTLYLKHLVQGQFRRAGLWLSVALVVKQFPLLLIPDLIIRALQARRRDALAWSVLPAAVLSLPYLLWSPREYLFILAGNVNAWRALYRGEWWNIYGFLAANGVPEGWVRALSLALLACAMGLIYWATWRRRLTALVATALIANAFWMLYHSSMATYIGWGAVFAAIALGAAWRRDGDP